MSADEVVAIVDHLEPAGIDVWLDGGWGVDALLERQTRPHDDLDLVVALEDIPRLQELLAEHGYEMLGGAPPMSFELVNDAGNQVDVHPVTWEPNGDGLYRMRDGTMWPYPASGSPGPVRSQAVGCVA